MRGPKVSEREEGEKGGAPAARLGRREEELGRGLGGKKTGRGEKGWAAAWFPGAPPLFFFFILFLFSKTIFPKLFLDRNLNANKFKAKQSTQNKACSSMSAYSCF